jgi:membrane protease subunit HflC
MSRFATVSLVLLAIIAWLAYMSVFVVREQELAAKFQLGEFVESTYKPGLHYKWPFINNVVKFDARILTLDMKPERYLTLEKKNVIVDSFVKWRIDDVRLFYKTTGGDERRAEQRLSQIIKEGLRNQFGKRTIQEAISGERTEIMTVITEQFARQAERFGVNVVDVRIKRIELPTEVSESVYRRMEAERARVAKELRAQGAEKAEGIKADAERQRTVILAEAYRDAQRLRGEGDAKASEVYAQAFGKNEEFYRLYRSLGAYQNVFGSKDDVLVLDPNSEFFRYFQNAGGK